MSGPSADSRPVISGLRLLLPGILAGADLAVAPEEAALAYVTGNDRDDPTGHGLEQTCPDPGGSHIVGLRGDARPSDGGGPVTLVPGDDEPGDDEPGRVGKAQRAAVHRVTTLVGKVVDEGVGPILGSQAYAEDRLARARRAGRTEAESVEAAIAVVIRESVAAAATAGFVTGLGGLIALPVTLPANVAGNLAINARMVGAIAHLRGYPLSDPHTRTVVMLTVAGSNLQSVASEFGVELGKQVARRSIEAIPMAVLNRINARAGFFLVAKYGTKRSAVTLARAVPVAGGLVGGSVDATLTGIIGKAAKRAFADDER